MRNKWYVIWIYIMLVFIITGCSNIGNITGISNDKDNHLSVETNETATTAQKTEIVLPDMNSLTKQQQSMLPYFNNGFCLTPGDRTLYYLGEKVAEDISVYADFISGYLWTVTSDFKVYYRGNVGNGEGKLLKTYDLRSGEDKEINLWANLEKYGDAKRMVSDGKHVFILFKGADRYNIVEIDDEGQDKLLSQFNMDYNKISDDNFLNPISSQEEYKFYIYNTTTEYSSDTNNQDVVNRKYIVDYRTSIYTCVDEYSCNETILSSGFIPTNKYYYSKDTEIEDDLTGFTEMAYEIYEYDRSTEKSKLLTTISIEKANSGVNSSENGFVSDKYLYCYGCAVDFNSGSVYDRNSVNDIFKSTVDNGLQSSGDETGIIHRIKNM